MGISGHCEPRHRQRECRGILSCTAIAVLHSSGGESFHCSADTQQTCEHVRKQVREKVAEEHGYLML